MKKLNIDLEQNYGEPATSTSMPEAHYPDFRYEGPEELPLPKSGTMTIAFKKIASSESKRGANTVHSCTIQVESIISVDGGEVKNPSTKKDEAGDALDRLMKEKEESEGEED